VLPLSIPRLYKPRFVALIILALVFASVTYGFAAANTVPAGNVGDGSGAISGYTVSNVKYNLNTSNPGNIDSVAFDLAGAVKPTTVKAKLVASGSTWYSCTTSSTTSPYSYTCATTSPQATVANADELRVVAAD
jgi:hypothetical protein